MPSVCFNTKWFILFMFFGFSIIGLSLFLAYRKTIENLQGSPLNYIPDPDPFPITPTMPERQLLRMRDNMYRDRNPFPNMYGFPTPPVIPRPPAPGYGDNYDGRIGFAFNNTKDKYRLPLYGQREYPGSRNYRYFVLDHTGHQNKIELDLRDFISNGDEIKIPGYEGNFTVQLYDRDLPRYFPN